MDNIDETDTARRYALHPVLAVNYDDFCLVLKTIDEEYARVLLQLEMSYAPRKQFVLRIHERMSALRDIRERVGLMVDIKNHKP